jgi:peptide subunit release factor RF-3
VRLKPLSFHAARWVTGPEEEIRKISGGYGRKQVADAEGYPMILFETEWVLARTVEEEERLRFHDVQPGRDGAQNAPAQVEQSSASGKM